MESLMNRRFVIAVLTVACLTTVLFVAAPIRSSAPGPGEYDPWLDWNDDGKVDMKDIGRVAKAFGTSGQNLSKASIEYEGEWIDITDKCGQNITIAHNLNSTDLIVDIQGKTSLSSGPHQRNYGITGYMQGWNKTYGGIDYDEARALVQTIDGGYALAGETSSLGAGGYDFWLVKTDGSGDIQWNQTYGGISDDYIGVLMALAYDGGYALAGTTNSFGAGGYDCWLVKTDANGVMQWNRTYGGTNDESMWGMIQTNDGGYAMVGGTNSFGAGGYDCWFVKTDSDGNMQWNKTYGSPAYDEMAYAVVQTCDGAYALLGSNHTGYERNDVLLFRLDSNGNVGWNRTYNRSYQNDFGVALVQNCDGGYTIAGLASSSWAEEYDAWLFRVDAKGNILWSKTYGGPATDQLVSICLTDDGGYAIAATTDSFSAGSRDFWLVKTDASGNIGSVESGLAWIDSSANTITLYRGATDTYWNYVRVRLWKPR